MSTTLKPVDAVIVGFGWTGAIMGQELCDAGLSVVALERGPWRDTSTDFATGFAQDELRPMWQHHLFQNVADDTLTIRNNVNQDALPMRHLGSFLLGTGVGSGGVHWNGQIWRFLPTDFLTKSHNEKRYGKKSVTDYDLTVQDWGTTYEELEPRYDNRSIWPVQHQRQSQQFKEQDPTGRQSLRRRASQRIPDAADGADLCAHAVRQRLRQIGSPSPFHIPPAISPPPIPTPWARSSAPALIAASVKSSAVATIQRRALETTICRLHTHAEVELHAEDGMRGAARGAQPRPQARHGRFLCADPARERNSSSRPEMVILSAYVLQNVRLLLLSGIGKPYDPKSR